jgi:hypothetical protein
VITWWTTSQLGVPCSLRLRPIVSDITTAAAALCSARAARKFNTQLVHMSVNYRWTAEVRSKYKLHIKVDYR